MRKAAYKIISARYPDIPVFSAGAVDENPPKPFIVYKLSGDFRGPSRTSVHRTARLEVWVHDDKGSYVLIDGMLDSIERALDGAVHVQAGDSRISQALWESRSPDLDDSGFGTLCKMTSYTIVGS